MAKIAIVSKERAPAVAFMAGLKKIVGTPLTDLRKALEAKAPIFEKELFLNNHEEIAQQIRDIGALARRSEIDLNYYEFQPGERFATCEIEDCKVNAETVENILCEWENRKST